MFRYHKDETEWLEIQSADLSKEGSEVNSPGVTIITWYPALSQSEELKTGYKFNFQEDEPDFNEWVARNIKTLADQSVASLLNDFLRAAQISAETSRFKRAAHIIIEKLGRLGF